MGLPMIVIDPIPGQETRNADFLLERGAAMKAFDAASVPYKVQELMNNPLILDEMSRRARELGRPDAAHELARVLAA